MTRNFGQLHTARKILPFAFCVSLPYKFAGSYRSQTLQQRRNSCSWREKTAASRLTKQSKHITCLSSVNSTNQSESIHHTPKIWLPDVSHTTTFGNLLALNACKGDVLLLHGQLGAGKTALARGYIQSARQDNTIHVTSPTYLLVNTYPPEKKVSTIPTVYHMDLWRIKDVNERSIVDFDHVFQNEIALIEWSDCLGDSKPHSYLDVHLSYPLTSQTSTNLTHDNSNSESTDPNDPWGFGDDDPGSSNPSDSGRYVQLLPHGNVWEHRVQQIIRDYIVINEEDKHILSPVVNAEIFVSERT